MKYFKNAKYNIERAAAVFVKKFYFLKKNMKILSFVIVAIIIIENVCWKVQKDNV